MAKKKDNAKIEQPTSSHDYETEGHLDTLLRAHDIMHDEGKMKKVHKLAGRRKKAISSLDDLKAYAQKKYGPKQDNEDME